MTGAANLDGLAIGKNEERPVIPQFAAKTVLLE